MKASKLILVVWLVAEVLGDKETLVDVPSDKGLWYWNTKKVNPQGAGWSSPPTASPVYRTCDISDDITKEPNNWLQTDFIDVKHAKRVDIEVSYKLLNCPSDASKFCKTFFTLYAYHTDSEDPIPDPTKGMFQKEAVITPKVISQSSNKYMFRGSVVTKAQGVYLAFLDQGVCVTLDKVVISYRFCSERGTTLVRFPRTVAPANDSNLIEQAGECTDKNSVSKVKLSGVCLSNGEWNVSDDLMCLCKAGYELINGSFFNGSVASLECKECPRGSFKTTINNTNCLQCLPNSVSNAERTDCTCDKGFYESTNLTDCKALPRAPLNANAATVKTTYIAINWHRSPDDNGMLRYAVDCFRCKSRNDKNCTEACGGRVRYSPRKDNITGVNVTVSGLSSSSFFLFRVYSVSELNQQEKDRDNWRYAELIVETKEEMVRPTEGETGGSNKAVMKALYIAAPIVGVLILLE